MKTALIVLQVIIAVLLILSILVQQRGSGLGSAFGGGTGFYVAKRGAEKVLSIATVVLVVFFVASSLAFLFV